MILVEKYNFNLRKPYITYIVAIILLSLHTLDLLNHSLNENNLESSNLAFKILFDSIYYQFYINFFYNLMFGDNVEDVIGHFKYLITFIFIGVISNFIGFIITDIKIYFFFSFSGAISGILGMYLIFFPNVKTTLFQFSKNIYFINGFFLDNIPYYWNIICYFTFLLILLLFQSKLSLMVELIQNISGFLIGIFLGKYFKSIGEVDAHQSRIISKFKGRKTILCPSCNYPNYIKRYGLHNCIKCNCDFYFDINGKKILIL